MTPEQFDALMDLVDHKILTMAKYGKLGTKVLRDKQGRLRASLIAQNESVPNEPADPKAELESDVLKARLATLRQERINIEQSDDRAFTNGRLRDIDKDIREIETRIAELETGLQN